MVITQVVDHVKLRLISQFIVDISRVLQKLLKYFNGTAVLTSFVLPLSVFLSIIITLDRNDSEFVII